MNIFTGLYALLLLVGGLMGYIKANSHPSLIMGTLSALLFFILAFQKGRIANYATMTLAFMMGLFFSYRGYSTHQFFPAGVIVILSLALVIYLLSSSKRKAIRDCKTIT